MIGPHPVGLLRVTGGVRPQGQLRAHQPGRSNVGFDIEAESLTSPFPELRQVGVAGPSNSRKMQAVALWGSPRCSWVCLV